MRLDRSVLTLMLLAATTGCPGPAPTPPAKPTPAPAIVTSATTTTTTDPTPPSCNGNHSGVSFCAHCDYCPPCGGG